MLLRSVPLSVPGAGVVKAFGLIQQLGLGLAHNGFESTIGLGARSRCGIRAMSVDRSALSPLCNLAL